MQKYYHKGAFYMDNTSLSKDENDVRKKSYDEVTGEDKFNLGAIDSYEFSLIKQRFESAQSDLIISKYDLIFKIKVLEFYFGIPLKI